MITRNMFKWVMPLMCAGLMQPAWSQGTKPGVPKKPGTVTPAGTGGNKPAVAKPQPPAIKPDTVKVPTFTIRFGPYNGSGPAMTDDLKKLSGTELIVTDQQGQRWFPLFWRFNWVRKEVTDDWQTGKRKIISTSNIVEIDSSVVLPKGWQEEIKAFVQPGEELIFEKIIVEHPGSKRKMLAPNLRFKVI